MEKVGKTIVDFWPHAEDPEKWGCELYHDEDDDDAFAVHWYRTKKEADRCAAYFLPK